MDRPQSSIRVLVHGLPYFGQMFANLMDGDGWRFRYFNDYGARNLVLMADELRKCDLAYQIGGRVTVGKFLHAVQLFKKKKIVMHWVGSDTLDEQSEVAEGKAAPWVLNGIHHWAESHWMVREVETLGTSCELVPLPSARVPSRPTPLPSKFSVLVYMPDTSRANLYGLDRILEVSRSLPNIPFELVGLMRGTIQDRPPNLRIHGRIPELSEFYRRASVVWRPVRHDGLSFMVMEALGHGRHVLWSYPFPGATQTDSADETIEVIRRLYCWHAQGRLEINWAGVEAIATGGYLPGTLRSQIRKRLQKIIES
jgi:hypothetical protein